MDTFVSIILISVLFLTSCWLGVAGCSIFSWWFAPHGSGGFLNSLVLSVSSYPSAATGPPNIDDCGTTLPSHLGDVASGCLFVDEGVRGRVTRGVVAGILGRITGGVANGVVSSATGVFAVDVAGGVTGGHCRVVPMSDVALPLLREASWVALREASWAVSWKALQRV